VRSRKPPHQRCSAIPAHRSSNGEGEQLLEKTLTDSYRKEIDQEENIWRSLPFFAATLALQLAALFQVIERLPSGISWPALFSYVLVAASVGCSLGALGFLASSIFPARFRYVAKDTALLEYALGLIEDEQHPDNQVQAVPMVALHALKTNLATQYALATDNNRQINKGRERRRSIAGLLTIFSVVSTLVLVAVTFATYVPKHDEKGIPNGSPLHPPELPAPTVQPKPVGPAQASPAAPDAGSH